MRVSLADHLEVASITLLLDDEAPLTQVLTTVRRSRLRPAAEGFRRNGIIGGDCLPPLPIQLVVDGGKRALRKEVALQHTDRHHTIIHQLVESQQHDADLLTHGGIWSRREELQKEVGAEWTRFKLLGEMEVRGWRKEGDGSAAGATLQKRMNQVRVATTSVVATLSTKETKKPDGLRRFELAKGIKERIGKWTFIRGLVLTEKKRLHDGN